MASPPPAPKRPSYTIEIIREEHIRHVAQFLRTFFFQDEPLNVSIRLMQDDEPQLDKTLEELENFCTSSINQGTSLMAISKEGKMVGVCLNETIRKVTQDIHSHFEDGQSQKFNKIKKLLDTFNQQADIFGKYPDMEQLLDLKILSVDDECRGQGIGKALIERTKEIAKEKGFSLIKVDCTSHFTGLAASRLGFHCVHSLDYETYTDQHGQRIFNTLPPHKALTMYVMQI